MEELIQDTLALMRIIEKTEEVGDCILWTGTLSSTGHPIFKMSNKGCQLVRREVFRMAGNELMPRKPIQPTCGEKLCVNPKHLIQSTTKKIAIAAAKRGAWKGVVRRSKISAAMRKRAKLTMEMALEIRMSKESGTVLAKRYSINRSLVNSIKRNEAWQDHYNPFAALM